MAIAMKGLRVRLQYEDLIGVAKPDGLEHIKFPNRFAEFLREGFFKPIRCETNAITTRASKQTNIYGQFPV